MFRTLAQVANATPPDYLFHAPKDPLQFAFQLITKAKRLFPPNDSDDGVSRMQGYDFFYEGPGAGQIIPTLIQQGHRAFGLETSRRGIATTPDDFRNYVLWGKPWELPIPQKQTASTIQDGQVIQSTMPFKMFHIGIINKYLKQILTPVEWNEAVKEIKKVSREAYVI